MVTLATHYCVWGKTHPSPNVDTLSKLSPLSTSEPTQTEARQSHGTITEILFPHNSIKCYKRGSLKISLEQMWRMTESEENISTLVAWPGSAS